MPAAAAAKPAAGSDISALIADEVADLKSDDNKPLSWHKTNISGMLYVSLSRKSGEDAPRAERVRTAGVFFVATHVPVSKDMPECATAKRVRIAPRIACRPNLLIRC